MRARAALFAAALAAAPAASRAGEQVAAAPRSGELAAAAWPETVTGVAEARIVNDERRFTTRLAFAAAIDPPRLRIEVVRGGTLQALAWYDEQRVLVLAPGEPSLVHEGPPTRETLERTLGLPFCPAEIFAALRGGLAPALACGDSASRPVEDGLELAASGGAATLRFSRFRRETGRPFPRRVTLESGIARATIDIVVLQESPKAPSPPAPEQLAAARRVGAGELAEALGLTPPAKD